MGYEFKEIGPEPQYPIIHRSELLRWIGVSGNMLRQIREEGLLPWKRITPDGHRYYRTADVRRVFLTNFKS
jgi:DNA-binding transcriptional MerR regulator